MFIFLLTDIFFYFIILTLIVYAAYVLKTPDIRETWAYVFRNKTGILSIVVLFFLIERKKLT